MLKQSWRVLMLMVSMIAIPETTMLLLSIFPSGIWSLEVLHQWTWCHWPVVKRMAFLVGRIYSNLLLFSSYLFCYWFIIEGLVSFTFPGICMSMLTLVMLQYHWLLRCWIQCPSNTLIFVQLWSLTCLSLETSRKLCVESKLAHWLIKLGPWANIILIYWSLTRCCIWNYNV